MPIPFQSNDPARTEATKRVSQWVRDLLAISTPQDSIAVTVYERRCGEPQFPPLETVVTVISGARFVNQIYIHMPVVDVTTQDLRQSFGAP